MIFLSVIIGILTGLAGHRTDRLFERLEVNATPRTWTLASRYGTGYLLCFVVFALMVSRKPWRDEAIMKMLGAGVFVGIGVLAGHLLDDLME